MTLITDAPRPLVKWAGGKSRLVHRIEQAMPRDIDRYTKYVEPFVGGGAMLCHMLNNYSFRQVTINDRNPALIMMYHEVRNWPERLIERLRGLEDRWNSSDEEQRRAVYDEWRRDYNESLKAGKPDEELFMALNKVCFNGLYRVNSKGEFNTPIGKYGKPVICDVTNIMKWHDLLNSTDVYLHHGDFQDEINWEMDGSTLIYVDPPYMGDGFKGYTPEGFTDKDNGRLASLVNRWDREGAYVVVSNSTADVDRINALYPSLTCRTIEAPRSISADGGKRRGTTEVLLNSVRVTGVETVFTMNERVGAAVFNVDDIERLNFEVTPETGPIPQRVLTDEEAANLAERMTNDIIREEDGAIAVPASDTADEQHGDRAELTRRLEEFLRDNRNDDGANAADTIHRLERRGYSLQEIEDALSYLLRAERDRQLAGPVENGVEPHVPATGGLELEGEDHGIFTYHEDPDTFTLHEGIFVPAGARRNEERWTAFRAYETVAVDTRHELRHHDTPAETAADRIIPEEVSRSLQHMASGLVGGLSSDDTGSYLEARVGDTIERYPVNSITATPAENGSWNVAVGLSGGNREYDIQMHVN